MITFHIKQDIVLYCRDRITFTDPPLGAVMEWYGRVCGIIKEHLLGTPIATYREQNLNL